MGCATRTPNDAVGNPFEDRLAGIERQQYDDWRADYTAESFGDFPAQDFGDFGFPGGADSIPVFNPDTGQWEAKSFEETWHKYHAQTVFAQTTYNQAANAGTEERWAHGDHRHGTPPNRYPETGADYFGFNSGYSGATGCQFNVGSPFRRAAIWAASDGTPRMTLIGPAQFNGYGQLVLRMYGNADGTATGRFFNDLDVAGGYSEGTTNRYTLLEVQVGDVKADSFIPASARSRKEDIRVVDGSLAKVRRLRPKRWRWKDGRQDEQTGFIADDVAALDADLATYNAETGEPDAWKLVDVVALLAGAVGELADKVDALPGRP